MSFTDHLSDYIEGVAAKYLSAVDARPDRSNQHEIGGLPKVGFKRYLGEPARGDKSIFHARLVYVSDDDEAPTSCDDTLTWYGATRRDLTRKLEYRLYYKSNAVTAQFNEGDFFLVAKLRDGTLLLVFAPRNSTAEAQLRVLFGLGDVNEAFSAGSLDNKTLLLPLRFLLEDIGFVFKEGGKEAENWLERLLQKFGEQFPATKEFSSFARESATDTYPAADPDGALIEWMDHEEHLFRILERHIVAKRLKQGFGSEGDDVEEFIKYSLSVQNRRKSRVGHAFEGHLEAIFQANKVPYERSRSKLQVTENTTKPDFIFPSFASYHDNSFPEDHLFLLGAKTTCKDRWRQVLAEGARVAKKHLVTLEPAISHAQTNEMVSSKLQLVVPKAIQSTYTLTQQTHLQGIVDFILEVKSKTGELCGNNV